MKVVVTGGNGFLGSWCATSLLQAGHDVRATVRDASKMEHLRDVTSIVTASLDDDRGWAEAMRGCDAVLHVASPFPSEEPRDSQAVIRSAHEGTLRVLRAAARADIGRVVMTSSSLAAEYGPHSLVAVVDDQQWSDLRNEQMSAYARSKTIAERAAWDFTVSPEGKGMMLSTILPTTILGPVRNGSCSTSVQIVERMLKGGMPFTPRLGFSWVDVRDVAALHRVALETPHAAGARFLASGKFLWLSEVANRLRSLLGKPARRAPKREAPDWVVRALASFDPSLKPVIHRLGHRLEYQPAHAQSVLGWKPRTISDTLYECASSLVTSRIQH